MKRMKCNQLGGPETCDHVLKADSWEQMQMASRKHAMENMESHSEAMEKMQEMMQDSEAMQKWMEDKEAEFEELEDN